MEQLRKDLNSNIWVITWHPGELFRLARMAEEHPEKMDEEYDGKLKQAIPDEETMKIRRHWQEEEFRAGGSGKHNLLNQEYSPLDRRTSVDALLDAQNLDQINKAEALSSDRETDAEDGAFSSAQNDPVKPKFSLSPSDTTFLQAHDGYKIS